MLQRRRIDGGLVKMEIGKPFRMTWKTRVFLKLYKLFENISQWFINHCDFEQPQIDDGNTQDSTYVAAKEDTTTEVPAFIMRVIEDQVARVAKEDTDYEKLLANIKYRIEALMREKGMTFRC
jgi:hypothetical protein